MPAAHTTDAEIVHALRAYRDTGSLRAAAKKMGLHRDIIAKRVQMATSRGLTADTPISDPLTRLEHENQELKAQIAQLKREEESAASIRRTIWKLAEYQPDPPKWLTNYKHGLGTPGAPMTNWSDWHYGERVRRAQTGGLNEYSSEIAAERIQRLADRTIRLIKGFAFKEMRKAPDFPGIVVCLGGDMISGDIHEELMATNDRTPNQCVDELTDLISAALEQMLREFPKVYVPCVVGNHGRTTRKPRMKNRVFTSWEWNLYQALNRHFKSNRNIHFDIPEETDVYFDCMGTKFLLTHGDSLGVKGGDGQIGPIGPIVRGFQKVMSAYDEIGKPVDHIICGHWHHELWIPLLGNVNNSLKGDDEFARLALRAKHSRPSQNLWFVHPEQGITGRFPVYVDEAPKPKRNPTFVSVFQ